MVWRGDPTLTADQQGMKVLGTPLGHSDIADAQLRHIIAEHQILLDRIAMRVVVVALLRDIPPQLRPEGVAP